MQSYASVKQSSHAAIGNLINWKTRTTAEKVGVTFHIGNGNFLCAGESVRDLILTDTRFLSVLFPKSKKKMWQLSDRYLPFFDLTGQQRNVALLKLESPNSIPSDSALLLDWKVEVGDLAFIPSYSDGDVLIIHEAEVTSIHEKLGIAQGLLELKFPSEVNGMQLSTASGAPVIVSGSVVGLFWASSYQHPIGYAFPSTWFPPDVLPQGVAARINISANQWAALPLDGRTGNVITVE